MAGDQLNQVKLNQITPTLPKPKSYLSQTKPKFTKPNLFVLNFVQIEFNFSCLLSQWHLNQEYLEYMLVLRNSCTDMYLFILFFEFFINTWEFCKHYQTTLLHGHSMCSETPNCQTINCFEYPQCWATCFSQLSKNKMHKITTNKCKQDHR